MKILPGLLAVYILVFSFPVFAKSPDCAGPNNWHAEMAESEIVGSGLTNRDELDYGKTKVVRLASEKMGRVPYSGKISTVLYRQVHRVTFVKKSGESITVITVGDASHYECSMSGVDVYLVSKYLGDTVSNVAR